MPDIKVFSLGTFGVNVDTTPMLTEEGEALQLQNATHDPARHRAGALTKRFGLDRFNTVSLGAAVLGGIEAPYAGTAGAPVSGGGGGGVPGDPGGTSDGGPTSTGAGPGTPVPPSVSGSGSGGSGSSGGSSSGGTGGSFWGGPLFGGRPIVVIGRSDNTSSYGSGWWVTSKGFQDTANLLTGTTSGANRPLNGFTLDRGFGPTRSTVGQTCNVNETIYGFRTDSLGARPNGLFFYTTLTVATGNQFPVMSIHRNDGKTDIVVATVPPNQVAQSGSGAALALAVTGGSTSYHVKTTAAQFAALGHLSNLSDMLCVLNGMPVSFSSAADSGGSGSISLSSTGGQVAAVGTPVYPFYIPMVVGMTTRYGDGGHVFVAVDDYVSTNVNTHFCRVFKMDTATYSLTEIFNSAATGNNNATTGSVELLLSGGGVEAWFGNMLQSTGAAGVIEGLVATPGMPDGYANWIGFEGPAGTPSGSDVTCGAIYKGALFTGRSNNAATPAFAIINGNPLSGIGQGTSLTLGADPQFTASGGSAVSGNYFVSMAIFSGALFASFYNPTQVSNIYKTTNGTAWTQVYTDTGAKANLNLHLDSDGDTLYAFGNTGTSSPVFLVTTDGATWTDKSANFPTTNASYPMNLFADFKQ